MKNLRNINIGQFTDSYQVPSTMSKKEAWKLLERKMNAKVVPVSKPKILFVHWKFVSLASAAAVIAFILWFAFENKQEYSVLNISFELSLQAKATPATQTREIGVWESLLELKVKQNE